MIKNAVIFALIALSVFLFFRGCTKVQKADDVIAKDKHIAKQIETQAEILFQKKDQDGVNRATIRADKNVVEADEASYVPVLDSAAERLDILAKQIDHLTVVNSRIMAEKLRAENKVDELNRKYYEYRDKHVSMSFRPDSLSGVFGFNYNADLTLTQYQKRKWFLGAKHSYIDIYSNDPRATVMGVRRLVVKQKTPSFGLRVQAMATYDLSSNSALFGPAARMDIGRFSIQAARLYIPEAVMTLPSGTQKSPHYVVAGTYDIFRF